MDRREFFRTVLRVGALGGLSALGVRALIRRADPQGGLPGQACTADGICARCASVPGCGLPQALSFKQARGS